MSDFDKIQSVVWSICIPIFVKIGLFFGPNLVLNPKPEVCPSQNFEIVSTSNVRFTTKTGPTNGPILTKIDIHIDQTFDYYHTKFYQNRTTLKQIIIGLHAYQFSSKSDHFWALFLLWNTHLRSWHPKILIFCFTH